MPHEKIAPLNEYQIAAQTGAAFTVNKGQIIRVIDVEGEQVAVIQHPPVFLNIDESLKKAAGLAEEAANQGAGVIAFPETWLPGFPIWLDLLGTLDAAGAGSPACQVGKPAHCPMAGYQRPASAGQPALRV